MLKFFYMFWYNFTFWLTITLDVLILISVLFSLIYAAFLLAASLSPFRGKIRPKSWFLPLALATSTALVFSPAGEMVAVTINSGLGYCGFGEGEWIRSTFVGLWALGLAVSLASLIRCHRRLGRGLKNLAEAPADAAFEEARQRLALNKVYLKELGEVERLSPFSWGLFRRFIGVPSHFATRFNYGERYAIYLHELTHIKNRDSLKYLLIGTLKALFCFNPIVGLALARYKNHLEIACDHRLIKKHGLDPLEYSRLMLRAINGHGSIGAAPGFSATYCDISRRLGYIFGDAAIIPVRRDRLLTALGLTLAALGLFCLNPECKGFPESYIPPEEIRIMPDGRQAVIKCVFQWQGALGGYTIARDVSLDEQYRTNASFNPME